MPKLSKWIASFIVIILLLTTLYLIPNTVIASVTLDTVNQNVCDRFEGDLNRLAAIMTEYRRRQGITQTRVAFGGINTPIEAADYQVTYAAEALAYQRAQKYSSVVSLKSSLEVLAGKIINAKSQVAKAIK